MDLTNLSHTELLTIHHEVLERIKEMERVALIELEQQAAQFGLQLMKAEPTKQRRKRRTKAEIESQL